MTGLLARSVTVLTVTGAVVLAMPAAPATAHVTVQSEDAAPGKTSTIALRVPNESETARTTRLQVQLPPEHSFEVVSVQTKVGWTYEIKTIDAQAPLAEAQAGAGQQAPAPAAPGPAAPEQAAPGQAGAGHDDGHDHGDGGQVPGSGQAGSGQAGQAAPTPKVEIAHVPAEIVWTATDPAAWIPPGGYDVFAFRVGPLPDVDSVAFKAVQTYDDGEVSRWIDPSGEGAADPAPVLQLRGVESPLQPSGPAPAAASGQPSWATWIALAGLVIALGALALGVRVALASRGARAPVS